MSAQPPYITSALPLRNLKFSEFGIVKGPDQLLYISHWRGGPCSERPLHPNVTQQSIVSQAFAKTNFWGW